MEQPSRRREYRKHSCGTVICLEESLFTDRSIVSVSTLQELFFGDVSLGFRRVPADVLPISGATSKEE